MTGYIIEDGMVVECECYATEVEAYKALVETLKGEAKAAEATEMKASGWKQPFRHACTLYFADGGKLGFRTLRAAFRWAVGGRELMLSELQLYAHATHCYNGGCENAIRAQFFALRNLIKSYRGKVALVRLERTGTDGYKYTAEEAK